MKQFIKAGEPFKNVNNKPLNNDVWELRRNQNESERKTLLHKNAIQNVLEALIAYTAPPSAETSWSGSSMDDNKQVNPSSHLACLMDNHNIAHICKNKTVNKDFLPSKGVGQIQVFQGLSVSESQGLIMANCCNPLCSTSRPLVEARRCFKSCHHCYTFYCSPVCRQRDWPSHKAKQCPMGRAVSATKAVIRKILSDDGCHNTFSNLGRGGYLRMGRGCIIVRFANFAEVDTFCLRGISALREFPIFVCVRNIHILISRFVPTALSSIHEACLNYDPEKSIVISVTVAIDNHILQSCPAKLRHSKLHAVKKCVTVSLSSTFLQSQSVKEALDSLRPTSMLLTMLPGQQHRPVLDHCDRQVIFINVLRKLESRGVDLKREYAKVYRDLVEFVEHSKEFLPTTIYPTDIKTGRPFVCMIAPMSDPLPDVLLDKESSRSSVGSFIAEIDAVIPNWEMKAITEV